MKITWASRPKALLYAIVMLGLGLRLWAYFRNPSVWHDELYLIANLLHKSFGELLGPLDFVQAGPPLFLWAERAAVLSLGESTYALRLLPLIASCVSLLLMVPIARRVLEPSAVPWALLLFGCSEMLLWHAAETKPYAIDVLAAVILAALFCNPAPRSLERRLLYYAALAPWMLALSYPSVFVYGGLLTAQFPEVWRRWQFRPWLSFLMCILAVGCTFGALWFGPIEAQRNPELVAYWRKIHQFPDWAHPWSVPAWSVTATFEVGRYCSKPVGQVLVILAVLGVIALAKRGKHAFAGFLCLPVAFAFAGSLAGAYPYGGSRLLVFSAPAFTLLVAAGLPMLFARLRRHGPIAPAVLAAFMLTPPVFAVRYVVMPLARPDCGAAAAYVVAHRKPRDAVAANNCESLYYFRNVGPAFTAVQEPAPIAVKCAPLPASGNARLWLIVRSEGSRRRARLLHELLPPAWKPVEQRHFHHIDVFLCEPSV
jgi:hypothetical protein